MKTAILTTLALLASLAAVPPLLAQTYNIPWHTVAPGGPSAGGVYAVSGGVDQSDAGQMSGGALTLAGGFWVFPEAPSPPALQYTIIDLGPFSGAPNALNKLGQIVGYSYTFTGDNEYPNAVFWPNGGASPLELGTLSGDYGDAISINDSGQVVGYSYLAGNAVYHATIWTNRSAGPIDLGNLGGSSVAASVNNSGQIVGYSGTPTNWGFPVFWPNAGSLPMEMGTLGGTYNSAYSINDSGQIIGVASPVGSVYPHAAFWANPSSVPRDLGTLGLEESSARAINNSGQIVGSAVQYSSSYQKLPIFWANGSSDPVRLATLGGYVSAALGINASGRIVGSSSTGLIGTPHAVLWNSSTSPASDLNDLIPPNSGWVLQSANAINDSGEIVGYGTVGGGPEQHAFALLPASNALRITSVTSGGSFLQIRFTSQAGHTYNVLSTSDLISGAWSSLQTGVLGNGGLVQVQVPIAPGVAPSRQFFRIQEGQ